MPGRSPHDQRSHVELITVYEICRILCGTLDIEHSFRAALTTLAAQMYLSRAMIVLPDEDQDCLVVRGSVGLTAEQERRGRWHVGEGVIGKVYAVGMPMVVPDVSEAPEFIDRTGAFGAVDGQMTAFVVVPLKAEHTVVGVLAAQRAVHGSERLSDDQRILTMVAALLGQALQVHQVVHSEHQRLQQETTRLRKALHKAAPSPCQLQDVIGNAPPMQRVFAEVHQAAPSRATVLIRGESGTGKEAIARSVHALSPRKDAPFIKVNCAALTESLLESELFGHERGAFTGALGDRKGRFELAHGGSLFLDEIGDISPAFQAKLLRVLQEREFERVGGTKAVKVDVRLICATNRDLETMVRRGEYRADLYYRINVIAIFVPPLRDRREDIPTLIEHFIGRYNADNQRRLRVTPEAMRVLTSCQWPGNVRELENCIERAATMAHGDTLRASDIACEQNRCLTKTLHHFEVATVAPDEALSTEDATLDEPLPTPQGAPSGERERLIWAMEHCGWVQAKAARLLKVSARQLAYALQKHQIEVRKL